MTTVTTSRFQKVSLNNMSATPIKRLGNISQFLQGSPRFSGDAFEILNEFKQKEKETKQAAEKALKIEEDNDFKAICDKVVWKGNDGKTLNVGEMIAFLCRRRPNDRYPGFGTVENLVRGYFPGMDIKVLEQSFDELYNNSRTPCYLGKDKKTKTYWLNTTGAEMIRRLYPDIKLPDKNDCFILYKPDQPYITDVKLSELDLPAAGEGILGKPHKAYVKLSEE